MIIKQIEKNISDYNLLNHRFYHLWSEGKLDKEILSDYAAQYYHHVKAFPRYISLIHSQCEDLKSRQILLENLIEEERGSENHPKLWRDFASELGNNEAELENTKYYVATRALVDKFFSLCKKSYASGLGALYTYEHQTPEVAKSKIAGLKSFYNIDNPKALKFFEVHEKADEWHSEEVAGLIANLSEVEQKEALASSKEAAIALWGFLDGMVEAHKLEEKCHNA